MENTYYVDQNGMNHMKKLSTVMKSYRQVLAKKLKVPNDEIIRFLVGEIVPSSITEDIAVQAYPVLQTYVNNDALNSIFPEIAHRCEDIESEEDSWWHGEFVNDLFCDHYKEWGGVYNDKNELIVPDVDRAFKWLQSYYNYNDVVAAAVKTCIALLWQENYIKGNSYIAIYHATIIDLFCND
jgi:hypothetical protein